MIGRQALALLPSLLALACSTSGSPPNRAAHLRCGAFSEGDGADTSTFQIHLDTAAAATLNAIRLEVAAGPTSAGVTVDSTRVGCASSEGGIALRLSGSWSTSPNVVINLPHFARTTVHDGDIVVLDTVIDMNGMAYRTVEWR